MALATALVLHVMDEFIRLFGIKLQCVLYHEVRCLGTVVSVLFRRITETGFDSNWLSIDSFTSLA